MGHFGPPILKKKLKPCWSSTQTKIMHGVGLTAQLKSSRNCFFPISSGFRSRSLGLGLFLSCSLVYSSRFIQLLSSSSSSPSARGTGSGFGSGISTSEKFQRTLVKHSKLPKSFENAHHRFLPLQESLVQASFQRFCLFDLFDLILYVPSTIFQL